jgi:hypothetical protein
MTTVRKSVDSFLGSLVWIGIVGFFIWIVLPDSQTAPWKYEVIYNLDSNKIHYTEKPKDCDFLHAPLGDKGCHYKKIIIGFNAAGDVVLADDVIYGSKNKTGEPIASLNGGKTWVDKGAPIAPHDLKVSSVEINWVKTTD